MADHSATQPPIEPPPFRPIDADSITTPVIEALLAARDQARIDLRDVSPWPKWQPQPDMLPPVDWRENVDRPEDFQ